ncbi:MinD/ParA family protein [uncultured Microbacterium sp.]|uniref:MinD/ParA family ATP-binding protein n=1 Tax=uncultured Microbacterium sp. TaxID=191216 RepID=UPI00261E188D|nr:MinD/ParA family protein [uncultured Microbacterium sp.]
MSHDHDESSSNDPDHGVLNTTESVDVSGVGIVDGSTAHVEIVVPTLGGDDDFDDDDVVLDDVALVAAAEAPAKPAEPAFAPSTKKKVDVGRVTRLGDTTSVPVVDASVEAVAAQDLDHHERVRPRTSEIALHSRRLGDFEADRESSDLLTSDRLLDPAHIVRPEPEGTWQHIVYSLSGRRINLGDSKRARARKELDRRIGAPLAGGARFVPVLSRKGGVGKTTVTTLLGMALADARDDRVIAVDANPDRGTLADRVGRASGQTVRDLVRARGDVHGFNDISRIVSRDETRLDVLASETDPHVSEAFSDADYQQVAEIAAHFYSIVLTDTGTGIVHSVMEATLDRADELVIVTGLSIDEARLAAETLTWLETNGFAEQARRAVVVLNAARPGAALVRASELDAHFRSRVRAVVRMPYDPHIASGSTVSFRDLQPETRQAARELAATVVEGLRVPAAV